MRPGNLINVHLMTNGRRKFAQINNGTRNSRFISVSVPNNFQLNADIAGRVTMRTRPEIPHKRRVIADPKRPRLNHLKSCQRKSCPKRNFSWNDIKIHSALIYNCRWFPLENFHYFLITFSIPADVETQSALEAKILTQSSTPPKGQRWTVDPNWTIRFSFIAI